MARRHIKSDFAPDVYVFPGGKADAGDAIPGDHVTMPVSRKVRGREAPAVGWRAIVMAAIRELFEESGLLLARGTDGSWATEPWLLAVRDQVRSGELSMMALASEHGLTFAGNQLCLFSNWITPEVLTRRFDTFFFLARLPAGAEARLADELELTHSLWIRPADALERFHQGEFPLVFATERHLEALARYDAVDSLWNASIEAVIEPISPRWHMRDGERVFVIPGDAGYESARTR